MSNLKIKPIITRPGGKTRLLPKILPLIAAFPHTVFCEAFCGGAAVLLAKPPSAREIINDLDAELINCFRQVRDHLPEVYRRLKAIPDSRAWFSEQLSANYRTEIDRAAAFLYLNLYSFSGNNTSYGPRRSGNISRFDLLRRFALFRKRLDAVSLESIDALECIRLYDSRETLFFLDPPYTTGDCGAYDVFSGMDMTLLANLLVDVKGKFVLTVDDTPMNRALFSRYPMEAVTTAASMRNHCAPGARFGELIIRSQ